MTEIKKVRELVQMLGGGKYELDTKAFQELEDAARLEIMDILEEVADIAMGKTSERFLSRQMQYEMFKGSLHRFRYLFRPVRGA